MELNDIKVRKRDNTFEPYHESNIVKVLVAAGMKENDANLVSQKISTWLKSNNTKDVSSLEIRDKVIEELELINTDVADLYKWYESTKNK
jgi:2-phosphoglycerate kinase